MHTVELQFPARRSRVAHVKVNGKDVSWRLLEHSIGYPVISVSIPASAGQQMEVCIAWEGELFTTPSIEEIGRAHV